jgi:hypothetical protein
MKRRYDELLAGEVCISLINEPIDLTSHRSRAANGAGEGKSALVQS